MMKSRVIFMFAGMLMMALLSSCQDNNQNNRQNFSELELGDTVPASEFEPRADTTGIDVDTTQTNTANAIKEAPAAK